MLNIIIVGSILLGIISLLGWLNDYQQKEIELTKLQMEHQQLILEAVVYNKTKLDSILTIAVNKKVDKNVF